MEAESAGRATREDPPIIIRESSGVRERSARELRTLHTGNGSAPLTGYPKAPATVRTAVVHAMAAHRKL